MPLELVVMGAPSSRSPRSSSQRAMTEQNFFHFARIYTGQSERALKQVRNQSQSNSRASIAASIDMAFRGLFGRVHLESLLKLLVEPCFVPLDAPLVACSTAAEASPSRRAPSSAPKDLFSPYLPLPSYVFDAETDEPIPRNLALHRLSVLSRSIGLPVPAEALLEVELGCAYDEAANAALLRVPPPLRDRLQVVLNHRLQDILSLCFQEAGTLETKAPAQPQGSGPSQSRASRKHTVIDKLRGRADSAAVQEDAETLPPFSLPEDCKKAAGFIPQSAAEPVPVTWEQLTSEDASSPLLSRHPGYHYELGTVHPDLSLDYPPDATLLFPNLALRFYESVLQHEPHRHYIAISVEHRNYLRAPSQQPPDASVIPLVWITLETPPAAPIVLASAPARAGRKYFRAIIRSRHGEFRSLYPDSLKPEDACQYFLKKTPYGGQKLKVFSCKDVPELRRELCKRDRDTQIEQSRYKFGILYCAQGNVHECTHPDPADSPDCRNDYNFFDSPLYRNEHGSDNFNQFVNWLGTRTPLEELKRRYAESPESTFLGGLHHVTGDAFLAQYPWFDIDISIIFHVSTALPFTNKPRNQQLERKAHIGNDIVVIIFSEDPQPFDPRVFISQFNHVFIVISKVGADPDGTPHYKLAVASKDTVPAFGPIIPPNHVFKGNDEFKGFLLTKLINAERSVYFFEESFRRRTTRVNSGLLLHWGTKFASKD